MPVRPARPARPARAARATRTLVPPLASALAAVLLLGGCGSASSSSSSSSADASTSAEPSHTMADGSRMSDSEMAGMEDGATHEAAGHSHEGDETTSAPGAVTHRDQASPAAAMVCSREIAGAVQRQFALPELPVATDAWSDQTYTCTYRLPKGELTLSVKDLDRAGPGRAYFDALARRLDATPIKGLQNLGFPAVEVGGKAASVAFLKDHKTLWADASKVAASDLTGGFDRMGAAYGVASAVIACWTE